MLARFASSKTRMPAKTWDNADVRLVAFAAAPARVPSGALLLSTLLLTSP